MFRLLALAPLAALSAWAVSPEASVAARDKLNRVIQDQMEPGEVLTVTEDELNSYVRYDYAPAIPKGVRDIKIRLDQDKSFVTAVVDFSKFETGGFLIRMLGDNKNVSSRVKLVSADELVEVNVESMQVNGVEMAGTLTTWLVNSFVAPRTNGFELDKPIPVKHKLEKLEIKPGEVIFTAK